MGAVLTQVMVATGDPRRPWATGLAFDGDPTATTVITERGDSARGPLGALLAAIGAAAEIQKLAGPDTRLLTAGGRSLTLPQGTVIGSRLLLAVDAQGCVTDISLVSPT